MSNRREDNVFLKKRKVGGSRMNNIFDITKEKLEILANVKPIRRG